MAKTDQTAISFSGIVRINVDMNTDDPFGLKFKSMDEFADWLASWFELMRNEAKAEIEREVNDGGQK